MSSVPCPLVRQFFLTAWFAGGLLALPGSGPLAGEEIVIGVEYAPPGLGKAFAPLGLPAAKFYPDEVTWGKMQPRPEAAIDFSFWDRVISEYQEAGFRELVLVLKAQSGWGSRNVLANFAPKPEHLKRYAEWVRAVVERYDGDGRDDLPQLRWPVRYYEVGSEFSSFEPGPTADYLVTLEATYQAAHAAYDRVQIAPAGFLVTTVFRDRPAPRQYEQAFAEVERRTGRRILHKSLSDIRQVLDHPEWFDVLAFHALGDPGEIEATAAWLRWEMNRRAYFKPLLVSDTAPTPFIAWGPATNPAAPPARQGIVVPPATEGDRVRLAAYFKKLMEGDAATVQWLHAFVAADMAQKIVISAEQEIVLVNVAFMEDLPLFQSALLQAGAGNSAWSGMAKTRIAFPGQKRTAVELRPGFYALGQLRRHLAGYDSVARVPLADQRLRLYQFTVRNKPRYVGWLEPDRLILPGDDVPEVTINLDAPGPTTLVEPLITAAGKMEPERKALRTGAGKLRLKLNGTPTLVRAEE